MPFEMELLKPDIPGMHPLVVRPSEVETGDRQIPYC
jgi:hypothetical protein